MATLQQGRRGTRKRGIPMPEIDYSKKNGVVLSEEDIIQAARPIVTATLELQHELKGANELIGRLEEEVRQLRGRLNNVLTACLQAARETEPETDARLANLAKELEGVPHEQ